MLILYYYNINIFLCFFPFVPIPLIPLWPSRSLFSKSRIVTNLELSAVAIVSATTKGSTKSIKILAGDEAKLAPAKIKPS